MKRTHPAYWGFGWAGLFVGALLTVLGLVDSGEAAELAGGYGLFMAGAAVYLLGGLGLRQTLARRAAATRSSVMARPTSTPSAATQPQT
jgi:hypothetical protein